VAVKPSIPSRRGKTKAISPLDSNPLITPLAGEVPGSGIEVLQKRKITSARTHDKVRLRERACKAGLCSMTQTVNAD
jgi:hypothetical protein